MAPCFSQGHTARTADMNPCPVLFFDTFSWPCCVLSQLCPLLVCCRKYSGSHLLCPQHLSSFPPSVVSEFPDGASLAPESILLSGRSGPLWLLLRPRLCSSLALTWSPAPGVGGRAAGRCPHSPHSAVGTTFFFQRNWTFVTSKVPFISPPSTRSFTRLLTV